MESAAIYLSAVLIYIGLMFLSHSVDRVAAALRNAEKKGE